MDKKEKLKIPGTIGKTPNGQYVFGKDTPTLYIVLKYFRVGIAGGEERIRIFIFGSKNNKIQDCALRCFLDDEIVE